MELTTYVIVQRELDIETDQESHDSGFDAAVLPDFLFRAMSEGHYQKSLREGFHQSDERGSYIGQAQAQPEFWKDMELEREGTVAGRWAYIGYISNAPDGIGRIVKIRVHSDDGWEIHPDDAEGGYDRIFQLIPVERFVDASEPIDSWFMVNLKFTSKMTRSIYPIMTFSVSREDTWK